MCRVYEARLHVQYCTLTLTSTFLVSLLFSPSKHDAMLQKLSVSEGEILTSKNSMEQSKRDCQKVICPQITFLNRMSLSFSLLFTHTHTLPPSIPLPQSLYISSSHSPLSQAVEDKELLAKEMKALRTEEENLVQSQIMEHTLTASPPNPLYLYLHLSSYLTGYQPVCLSFCR